MRPAPITGWAIWMALVAALAMPVAAVAAGGDVLWEDRTIEGTAGSITTNASVVNGDAVFVAGTVEVPQGEGRAVRAYAAATGRLLWQDVQSGSERLDKPVSIAAEGNAVFTAGVARVNQQSRYFVRAYDRRNGRVLWEDVMGAGFSSAGQVVVKNGRLFVAGSIDYAWPQSGSDSVVRAYNARTGALLWQRRRGAPGSAEGVGNLRAEGGRLFLTHYVWQPAVGSHRESAIEAYDPVTGALLWDDREVVTGPVELLLGALDVAGSRVFVTGALTRAGEITSTLVVRAYDAATGELLWEKQRSGAGEDWGGSEHVSAQESRVFVSVDVYSQHPNGDSRSDIVVAGFEAITGRQLWEDRIDVGPDDNGYEIVASSDRLFVTAIVGTSWDHGIDLPLNQDYFVRAYDAQSGQVRWTDQIDAGDSDWALAIATQADRVFAAGMLSGDFFVRAYEGR